jgi:hypothetical protein
VPFGALSDLLFLCMLAAPAPAAAGLDVLTFDLLSIVGKIRAGLGAIGIKKPLPGAPTWPADWAVEGRRIALPAGHTLPLLHAQITARIDCCLQTMRRAWSSMCGATLGTKFSSG